MPEATPLPRPARRWTWRLAVVLILALGVVGFVALQVLKPRPAVRPPAKQLPIVQAAPVKFREGSLPVTGNGLVKPRAEVTLAAEVAGRVAQVSPSLVTGGAFRRGEVLVRLDTAPFEAALAQARAERQSAEAALGLAEQQLRRTRELIEEKFLSRQTLDERLANRDQAQAALARAEAVLESRRIDLARTEIRAPFDGRVLTKQVDGGDTVQPGRELARIFDAGTLEVAVSLTDRDMALIDDPWRAAAGAKRNAGVEAAVTVQHGAARYRWRAKLDRIEAAVDSATRTFSVVVRVDDPQARGEPVGATGAAGGEPGPPLLVGMYARVELPGRDQGRYALVPRRAVRDGSVLWLLDDAGKVSITPVRLLHEDDDAAAVSAAGIPAGTRVIVSDLKVVTQGMAVRAIEPTGAAPAASGSAAQ